MRNLWKLALAAVFLPTTLLAQTDVVGLYLTWQRDPARTMTVNWVNLYEHTTTNVFYRELGQTNWASAQGTRHVVAPSVYQVRRVELTGLKPATDYQFIVAEQVPADERNLQRFRTLPAELQKPLRFVTGGDMMHTREMVDAMNRRAGRLDPDFALLGGDLAYADGVYATRWFDWMQSWTQHARGRNGRLIPMVVAIGNHEVRGGYNGKIPADAPYFYGFFALPENRSYYALDFGKYLSLVVLDSGHTQPISGAQATWLEQAMAARTEQQFLFPCYHWPAYGTTKEPKDKLPHEHPRSREIQQQWIPHFERHGVTAVFENDHHNYKRTHPIRNDQRDDQNGIIYLGDGAWGVGTRTVPAPGKAWYLAHAEPRRHLFEVTLNPDGQVQIRAVDADAIVFDQTELRQARTRPATP
jgi:acid phosphatase type 7